MHTEEGDMLGEQYDDEFHPPMWSFVCVDNNDVDDDDDGLSWTDDSFNPLELFSPTTVNSGSSLSTTSPTLNTLASSDDNLLGLPSMGSSTAPSTIPASPLPSYSGKKRTPSAIATSTTTATQHLHRNRPPNKENQERSARRVAAKRDQWNAERVRMSLPPRLLKQDPRRLMSRMLSIVMNSFDVSLVSSFFCQHSTPSSELVMHFHNPFVDYTNVFRGFTLNTAYWMGLMRLAPDKTFRLENAQLITQYGSLRCRLEMDFTVQGTKLYNIFPNVLLKQLVADFETFLAANSSTNTSAQGPNHDSCPIDVETATADVIRYTAQYDPVLVFHRLTGSLPPLSPVSISLKGRLIVHFNEHKLIDLMDVESTSVT
jgi:hypothetical protein